MVHIEETFTGKTVGGFQILRLLGRSQLGAAYLAQHPTQGHKVMITIFHVPEGQVAQEYEQLALRVTREGEALTRLNHPQILSVYACGIQASFAYLITAFAKEASLAQLLKQNQRFTPQQVLPWLKQLATALDFAHSQGVVHGMLSLSNVLVNDDLNVCIAGFGLRILLDMYGKTQQARPLEHLSSIHGAFLGNPDSLSPERVLGLAIDARADVYALGTMLFTLLSGSPPFRGEQHLDSILQRVQQPAPLLHTTCPDLPEVFDMVVGKMLERDPAKRTASVGGAAVSFERVVKAMAATSTSKTGPAPIGAWMQNPQITIPPTVNWFDEAMIPSDPPYPDSSAGTHVLSTSGASPEPSFSHTGALAPTPSGPTSLEGTDPFLWWSSASTGFQSPGGSPGTFTRRPSQRLDASRGRRRPGPGIQDRRNVVKMITIGAVAGAVTLGGISLVRIAQGLKQPSQLATASGSGATTTSGTTATVSGTPTASATAGATSSPTAQPTTGSGGLPSPTAQPKPTQPPAPTPTPTPGHTGTVIGHTNQANNSAVQFTNPADGKASFLIRMPNGNFIACETACTHAGVACNYDAGQHLVTCPAHGATFDPANGFAPTSPAPSPLPKVSIRVNGDGTITTG